MTQTELLHIAIRAALQAGKEILNIYRTDDFGIDYKADESPLTKADLASHRIIASHLENTGIPVLSEEGSHTPYEERNAWEELWIVDPIDGTKEFIRRNGDFTVNIALVRKGLPVLGVIYVPVHEELYFATEDTGSFKVKAGTDDHPETLISGARKLPMEQPGIPYTVVASRSHMSPETEDFIHTLKQTHPDLQLMSRGSSLKLCMVAEGSAHCYPRFAPTMEWDTAAGQAICMYAGFDVLDYSTGETMRYNRENLRNNWFIVQ